MKVYMFKAALWCGQCIRQVMIDHAMVEADFDHSNHDPESAIVSMRCAHDFLTESDYDSDDYPKGPYGNGGGEADTPQHCDGCGCFLENPLTPDGIAYTADAIRAFDQEGDGAADVIAVWRDYYFDEVTQYNESLWDERKQH